MAIKRRMPKAGMHRDHALDPRRPRTHRGGENPGLEVGAEVPLGEQDDVEARAVGGAQDLLGEIEGRIDLGGRQRLQRAGDRLLDRFRSDGDVRDRCVEAELHRGFPSGLAA